MGVGRLGATWPFAELLIDGSRVTIRTRWGRPSVTLPLDGQTTVSRMYRLPLLDGVMLYRDGKAYVFGLLSGNAALLAALAQAGARPAPRPGAVSIAGGKRWKVVGALVYHAVFFVGVVYWVMRAPPP